MVLQKGVISLVLLVPGWSKVRLRLALAARCRTKSPFSVLQLQEVLLSYIANPQLELALVMLIVPFVVNVSAASVS